MPMVDNEERLARAHVQLRRLVGVIGVSLPVVLVLFSYVLGDSDWYRSSLSSYHGSVMRDWFVGSLFAVGAFLMAYPGYNDWEDALGWVTGIASLGVGLFPNTSTPITHYVSAAIFLVGLTLFSLVFFTRSKGTPSGRKLWRNRVYITCGAVMVLCLIAIVAVNVLLTRDTVRDLRLVFWLESIALVAFGVSWFVKGDTILRDL